MLRKIFASYRQRNWSLRLIIAALAFAVIVEAALGRWFPLAVVLLCLVFVWMSSGTTKDGLEKGPTRFTYIAVIFFLVFSPVSIVLLAASLLNFPFLLTASLAVVAAAAGAFFGSRWAMRMKILNDTITRECLEEMSALVYPSDWFPTDDDYELPQEEFLRKERDNAGEEVKANRRKYVEDWLAVKDMTDTRKVALAMAGVMPADAHDPNVEKLDKDDLSIYFSMRAYERPEEK